jgi:hypothetical protein
MRFAWIDYFPGTSPTTTLNSSQYTSKQILSGTNVYVSNCLFNKCVSSSDHGGALSCTSEACFFVESSSFFSCKMNGGRAGAIYFANTNGGQCVLHKVCGFDCISSDTWNGQFAYMGVKNAASNKNYVNYSSIIRCVNDYSDSYNMLYQINGKICLESVNLSMNKCGYRSGTYFSPFVDSSSVTCSFLSVPLYFLY